MSSSSRAGGWGGSSLKPRIASRWTWGGLLLINSLIHTFLETCFKHLWWVFFRWYLLIADAALRKEKSRFSVRLTAILVYYLNSYLRSNQQLSSTNIPINSEHKNQMNNYKKINPTLLEVEFGCVGGWCSTCLIIHVTYSTLQGGDKLQ